MPNKYREGAHTVVELNGVLSAAHLKMLREESAIADEVIAVRGYYTEEDPKGLADLGFDKKQQKLVPALVIPIRDITGEVVLHRIRPDSPRPNLRKPEKVNKYEAPTGSKNVLDFPLWSAAQLDPDPNEHYTIWFCEGEKKADAMVSQGLITIGLLGVWSWKRDKMPLPDFDRIPLIGKNVNVLFDSDAETNVGINLALHTLANYLKVRTSGA